MTSRIPSVNNKFQNPYFSILTPVYNSQAYLLECIESVLNQSFEDFELILINDGSTDESGRICDKCAALDERVKVFHQTNSGPLYSRIRAIELSKGRIILFLDSDDKIARNALDTIYSLFENNNVDMIVFGYYTFCDNHILFETEDIAKTIVSNKRELYRIVYFDNSYNALWRKAFKRELYVDNCFEEYYHLSVAEDLLQSISLYSNANSTLFIPDKLYYYRSNENSIIHTMIKPNYKPDYSIQERVLNTISQDKVFTKQDYFDYQQHCVKDLINTIRKISCSNLSLDNKAQILEYIRNSQYYNDFLKTIIPNNSFHTIICIMFRYNMYRGIINLYELFR